MKRIISCFLILTLIFSFTGCVSNNGDSEPIVPSLSEVESSAQTVLISLRNSLKNPSSLQVHSVEYVDTFTGSEELASVLPDDFTYIFKIDYSGENGFGGMNRKTIYVYYYNDDRFIQDFKNSNLSYNLSEPKSNIDISKLNY